MIPAEAVEAALAAFATAPHQVALTDDRIKLARQTQMLAALEAAAPYTLSHEREETRLAHVDAVVNAETVGQLQEKLNRVEALADKWWANFPSKARAVMEAIKD